MVVIIRVYILVLVENSVYIIVRDVENGED